MHAQLQHSSLLWQNTTLSTIGGQNNSFSCLASSVLVHPLGAVHSNTSAMQIIDGLIQLAIANEIGAGPSLKEAMEQEVNEQVGLPPSQGASESGSQKGQ